MSAPRLLEPYTILENLLKAEQQAFQENDAQRLAALALQIRECGRKVGELDGTFGEFTPEQLQSARTLVAGLQKRVQRSQALWEGYRLRLEEERDQLRSTRRYVHEAKRKQTTRGNRISHSV